MSSNLRKIEFLQAHAKAAPEYADLFRVFLAIFEYLESRHGETGIAFSADTSDTQKRIENGFPLLDNRVIAVDQPVATRFFIDLLTVIEGQSRQGGAELSRLREVLAAGRLDLAAMLGACLRRERAVIDDTATACGVTAPLLEFVLEALLRAALEPFAAGVREEDVAGWQEGYCPVCGSRAGMAELTGEEGRRFLSCSACFFKWAYKRLQCPFCGNEDSATLSYFTVDDGPTRVDVCRTCSRYLKTRDSRKGRGDVPLEAEDLATIHLDLMAGKEGLERGK